MDIHEEETPICLFFNGFKGGFTGLEYEFLMAYNVKSMRPKFLLLFLNHNDFVAERFCCHSDHHMSKIQNEEVIIK